MITTTFNINGKVKVRLTKRGHRALVSDHLNRHLHLSFDAAMSLYACPAEDCDGYSTWVLWDLMRTLGPYMEFGGPLVMETSFVLVVGQ